MNETRRHFISTLWFYIIWGVMIMLPWGCGKTQISVQQPAFNWVEQASGAVVIDQQPVFLGIGKAEGLGSMTLLRVGADNLAQAELGRVLKHYLAKLTEASDMDQTLEADRQIIVLLHQSALQKARITDHQYDEKKNILYARCELALSSFRQILLEAPGIEKELKQKMTAASEKIFATVASTP